MITFHSKFIVAFMQHGYLHAGFYLLSFNVSLFMTIKPRNKYIPILVRPKYYYFISHTVISLTNCLYLLNFMILPRCASYGTSDFLKAQFNIALILVVSFDCLMSITSFMKISLGSKLITAYKRTR
jgi:hypothetical protein